MQMMHDDVMLMQKRKTNNFLIGKNPGALQSTPLTRDRVPRSTPRPQEERGNYRVFRLREELLDTTNKGLFLHPEIVDTTNKRVDHVDEDSRRSNHNRIKARERPPTRRILNFESWIREETPKQIR